MAHHHHTGLLGEQLAKEYLVNKEFTILHTNWRHSHWEVDIIASKNSVLHFIEVKTRRTEKFGYPEDDVSKKKIENLIHASGEYQVLYPGWKLISFDILSITLLKNKSPEYFFIEDVYFR